MDAHNLVWSFITVCNVQYKSLAILCQTKKPTTGEVDMHQYIGKILKVCVKWNTISSIFLKHRLNTDGSERRHHTYRCIFCNYIIWVLPLPRPCRRLAAGPESIHFNRRSEHGHRLWPILSPQSRQSKYWTHLINTQCTTFTNLPNKGGWVGGVSIPFPPLAQLVMCHLLLEHFWFKALKVEELIWLGFPSVNACLHND